MLAAMKRPTVASLKKVTPENLAALGVERLAEILVAVADTRPDVKRRLRMELAAAQGGDHLAVEIDKRLVSLQTSRGKVSWRQRPTFVRDLDILRALIADRLAPLDGPAALERLWLFMELTRRLGARVRDKDGEMGAVFDRAASDIGALIGQSGDERHAEALVAAMVANPPRWAEWLPLVLASARPGFAEAALQAISARAGATPGWMPIVRRLADAAGNIEAFRATYTGEGLKTPGAAAEVGRRLLAAGRVEEAGALLQAAGPKGSKTVDFDWESVWIDYLEQSGQGPAAQTARWASFERTLSGERAKAFTQRLGDFEDVEAEGRAFAYAANHPDLNKALALLMEWPALPEAARLIAAREDEIAVQADLAELWAGRLRNRYPKAAYALLRKAAAAAFRQRAFAACDRLTAEADAIPLD